MPTTETLLILANSEKKGDRCVAGKRLTLRSDNRYDVGEWLRPIHPQTHEGEIPTALTFVDGKLLNPLDIVEIQIDRSANDPDHPEDRVIVTGQAWKRTQTTAPEHILAHCDTPEQLWGAQPQFQRRVPQGYVRNMNPAFTLSLIHPDTPTEVEAFFEPGFEGGTKFRKKLHLSYKGFIHEFDITDPAFIQRHNLRQAAKAGPFRMTIPAGKAIFSLSLTPAFHGHHYKIAAAIIELP